MEKLLAIHFMHMSGFFSFSACFHLKIKNKKPVPVWEIGSDFKRPTVYVIHTENCGQMQITIGKRKTHEITVISVGWQKNYNTKITTIIVLFELTANMHKTNCHCHWVSFHPIPFFRNHFVIYTPGLLRSTFRETLMLS